MSLYKQHTHETSPQTHKQQRQPPRSLPVARFGPTRPLPRGGRFPIGNASPVCFPYTGPFGTCLFELACFAQDYITVYVHIVVHRRGAWIRQQVVWSPVLWTDSKSFIYSVLSIWGSPVWVIMNTCTTAVNSGVHVIGCAYVHMTVGQVSENGIAGLSGPQMSSLVVNAKKWCNMAVPIILPVIAVCENWGYSIPLQTLFFFKVSHPTAHQIFSSQQPQTDLRSQHLG